MSNTKKNKTCINYPDELNPFNMITAWVWLDTFEGVGDMVGDIIGGING